MGPGVGAAGLTFLVLAQATAAWASTFTVNPVQLVLTGRARSALLTLTNTSPEPLRFQLSVVAWDQSPQGELVLTPTRDIAFFPRLLSLGPGEERKVRVGALVPPGTTEKTYRIFVEELPPREPPGGEPGARVRVLTRMGIPIFLRPANPVVEGRIEAAEVRNGRLSFRLVNRGTVHFLVQEVRLTGLGAGGEPVLSGDLGPVRRRAAPGGLPEAARAGPGGPGDRDHVRGAARGPRGRLRPMSRDARGGGGRRGRSGMAASAPGGPGPRRARVAGPVGGGRAGVPPALGQPGPAR